MKQHRTTKPPEIRYDRTLPIYRHLEEIRKQLKANQVLIVAGETGSGKTTQLPIACLESGFGIKGAIAHTQPRRLAARAVSRRIAEQLQVELGQEVGYAVRFDERVNNETRVKVMTDGLLLSEINRDRYLRKYEVVIVDEAHERTLNIDFLLGFLHRLLQRRRDLKVIITSATIDVESFSSFFWNAPVIQVEGRSYPVNVEYRPPVDDVEESVYQSIDEVLSLDVSGPRDTLMFLPTEQEILQWSNRIRRRYNDGLEVLPLYARLPPKDQQRIFSPSGKQRILLSTNVAETSLTVPNIRYVIDTGTARISRYNARSQIQRLPIEQISQASANQRKGRCGRVAPGTCFRIYDEGVFDRAQLYTEPEIRRTNLASVLLQIKYFRLGDIRTFPFIDPPQTRSIEEAERLLDELDAIKNDKLTSLGKQMARLPIEPRFARILMEASRRKALREILIIVSVLSIQDPRVRPINLREAADDAHAKFRHDRSDFMTLLRIWNWAEEIRQEKTSTILKQQLERHFISPARYFEWRSLHRQLHGYCQQLKLRNNTEDAKFRDIHLAILTGSLGLIGVKDDQRNYTGVRNNQFQLMPGSAAAKGNSKWVMAAEIVETQRVYARTVAQIERKWIESVAKRHLKVSYYDPYWDEKRGEAMTLSRASLYGLPVYERRPVRLAPMREAQAQELFVQNALVVPKLVRKWEFLEHNVKLLKEVLTVQAKHRQTDLIVSEPIRCQFYIERLPDKVVSVTTLERWLKEATKQELKKLQMSRDDLLLRSDEELQQEAFPSYLKQGTLNWRLRYRFAPGDKADGVSVQVRRENLSELSEDAIGWLVPGRFPEKCTELIKALPKTYRRQLVPVPDRVKELCDHLLKGSNFGRGNLEQVLSDSIQNFYRVKIPDSAWDPMNISAHLRMNVQLVDHRNRVVDEDRDLKALKGRNTLQLKHALSQYESKQQKTVQLTTFPDSGVRKEQKLSGNQGKFRVFPAFVDKQDHVSIEMCSSTDEQANKHERGLARLILLAERQSVRFLKKEFQQEKELALQFSSVATSVDLLDSILMASARQVFLQNTHQIWEKAQFQSVLENHRGELVRVGLTSIDLCREIVSSRFKTSLAIQNITSIAFEVAKSDLEEQLMDVVPGDFMWSTPYKRLKDIPRYLDAMKYRAGHLQGRVEKDADLMNSALGWERRLKTLMDKVGPKPDITDARYLLAENRVALFHQRLGTKEKVSQKRLSRVFEQLERQYAIT